MTDYEILKNLNGKQSIKMQILLDILGGIYVPGAMMPSQEALTEVYHCGKKKIIEAEAELKSDGILYYAEQIGTFVSPEYTIALTALQTQLISELTKLTDFCRVLGISETSIINAINHVEAEGVERQIE